MSNQVKIGPKFFLNERRVYRDWKTSWGRENLQNSVDALSSRIDINISPASENTSICVVSDNGIGMTQQTLEDVYFTLGETTKDTNQTIGGYGKARILTCFSQINYSLHTGYILVSGSGSEYTISKSDKHHDGVNLAVEVDASAEDMRYAIRNYLSLCQLSCDVYLDGEKWNQWTYRNRFARELTFGKVYTNKSASPNLLVRVNGTLMYTRYTSAPAQIVLEITPEISREVLQASRDGLMNGYQDELDSFLSELAINKRSALNQKRNKSTAFRGTGTFVSKRKQKQQPIEESNFGQGSGFAGYVWPSTGHKHHLSGYSSDYSEYKGLNLFDVIIEDDTTNSAVRKVIDQYDPRNWDLDSSTVRSNVNGAYRRGMGRLKLMLTWKSACEKIISILQDIRPSASDEITWGVGWYFSDDGAAACKSMNGVEYLLLNPCDSTGKMKFKLSNKADLCKLIAYAAHEIAHICCTDHDEYYAGLLTDLMNAVLHNKQDILNHMKIVKESAIGQLV
jgi:hypothetical protein